MIKRLRKIPAPVWITWAACLLLGCVLVVMNPIFSPIDEQAHYRVIEYIANEHALPNMIIDPWFYESVQPPLYYLFMALPFRFFAWDMHLQVLVLRGLNVCMLLGMLTVCFALESVLRRIVSNFSVGCYRALFLFFCFSPGVLTRFSTISNEPLAVLFSALCFYWLLRMLADGVTQRSWLFCSIFLAAAVMTKITTVFWFAPLFCLLLWQKKLRYFFASTGIVFTALVPWFISNYRVYGALTGMAEHTKFISGVAGTETKDVWEHSLRMFLTFFLSPEAGIEGRTWLVCYYVSIPLSLLCMAFLLYGIFLAIRFFSSLLKDASPLSLSQILLVLTCAAFAGNISTIYYGSFSSGINLISGRYLMHSIPCLAIFGAIGAQKLPSALRKILFFGFYCFLFFFLAISFYRFFLLWMALQ